MRLSILTLVLAIAPIAASASTKSLECTQTTDDGTAKKLYVSMEDASDKAEVESFALSAQCAAGRSCGTDVYKKDVLPSVIRLSNVLSVGGAPTYTTTIDIDRSTLDVVTRTKLSLGGQVVETIARGSCTVEVSNPKKLL